MAILPFDPRDIDRWLSPDELLEPEYEFGYKDYSAIPLKGDWLKAYQMTVEHEHYSIYYRNRMDGDPMDVIAQDEGVDKATISRRIQRLEDDLNEAFPGLRRPEDPETKPDGPEAASP